MGRLTRLALLGALRRAKVQNLRGSLVCSRVPEGRDVLLQVSPRLRPSDTTQAGSYRKKVLESLQMDNPLGNTEKGNGIPCLQLYIPKGKGLRGIRRSSQHISGELPTSSGHETDNNVNGLEVNWTFHGISFSVIISTSLVHSWFGTWNPITSIHINTCR